MDTVGFNPYAPPRAEVDEPETTRELVPASEMLYVGFWLRFFAGWIDVAALLPLMASTLYFEQKSRMFHLYAFLPTLVVWLWFHVYLVERYGGTPGKLLLKIRIAMADGAHVTLKAAALRYGAVFVLSGLSSWAMILAALSMTDEMYLSLSYMERNRKLVEMAPSWYFMAIAAIETWFLIGFLTMMFNKKRRAVHDFMAGTVVIRSGERATAAAASDQS
jgi:uncharacterized RDD family membrane protein YckC